MNRGLLIGITLIVVCVAFYSWWEFNHQPATRSWDLVPAQALIVYPYYKNTPGDPTSFLIKPLLPDSLARRILETKGLLVSVHLISNLEMGTLLYFSGAPRMEKKIISTLQSRPGYHERTFDGFKIMEGSAGGKKGIAAAALNGTMVISSSSLLVEDVIRLAKAKERQNFSFRHPGLLQFPQMQSDSAYVCGDLSQFARFFNLFLLEKSEYTALDQFAQSIVAESKRYKESLLFSGFALDSLAGKPSVLSLFNRQHAVPLTLQRFVSNRAGLLVHFGISDFAMWNQDRLSFSRSGNPHVVDSLKSLRSIHGFDPDQFYQSLDKELGLCQSGAFSGQLLIVELKDPVMAANLLNKLDRRRGQDMLPFENYAHYQVHFLELPALSRTLFWPLTYRPMSFYAVTDRFVIFSEQLNDLKSFLSDVDSENTWGKSSDWNEFLSTSQDTNVGVIFDGVSWWQSIRNALIPSWRSFGDSTNFLNIGKGSFQFSRLEKSYYFNGSIKFNLRKNRNGLSDKGNVKEVLLVEPVISGITIVRNHNTGQSELLVQDASYSLKLFSTGLKNLFSAKIDGRIASGITQIDYLKNKKLQYLFATERNLYLIDRLGNAVKGFPKTFVGAPVKFLTVIDYDHTRNYRFLVADTKGALVLLDREGKIAPDWKKIEMKSELWVAPRPVRNLGKDYLIAMTQDGMVYGLNRKGEILDGFPVNLKMRPSGNWIFETKGDEGIVTVANGDGLVVQFNLKGKIISRSNLARSSASSRFELVTSPDLNHYRFSRIDRGKIAVLDGKGEVVFEKENPGSEEMYLSWFELEGGRDCFAFSDRQQEFTYLFGGQGKALFSQPIENQQMPVVTNDKSGSTYFYGVNKNSIQCYQRRRLNE